jgi:hypothetical protein
MCVCSNLVKGGVANAKRIEQCVVDVDEILCIMNTGEKRKRENSLTGNMPELKPQSRQTCSLSDSRASSEASEYRVSAVSTTVINIAIL